MEQNLSLAAHRFSFWYWKLGGNVIKPPCMTYDPTKKRYGLLRNCVHLSTIFFWALNRFEVYVRASVFSAISVMSIARNFRNDSSKRNAKFPTVLSDAQECQNPLIGSNMIMIINYWTLQTSNGADSNLEYTKAFSEMGYQHKSLSQPKESFVCFLN